MKAHLEAQRAIVRMLFDPLFAAAVRADAEAALPSLPKSLRTQLAAIDPRALKLDPLLRRKVLRALFDEYKASTTIFLSRTKKLAALEDFFASSDFREAIGGGRLAWTYARFLERCDSSLSHIINIELGLAQARRRWRDIRVAALVHRAQGVEPIATSKGALAAMQQAEQYLFEVGLMPAVALCDDAPPLILDERTHDPERLSMVTVPTATGHSLVTIDDATFALLAGLPRPMSPALQPLLDDELVVQT